MQTALRCPMCGTMNPVGNVNCERCQARLIPLAAPQHGEPEREQEPIREPTPPVGPPEEMGAQSVDERAPTAEPEEPEAGDWLAQLRASAAQETVEPDVIDRTGEKATSCQTKPGGTGADRATSCRGPSHRATSRARTGRVSRLAARDGAAPDGAAPDGGTRSTTTASKARARGSGTSSAPARRG
jgi:hypothetical protein